MNIHQLGTGQVVDLDLHLIYKLKFTCLHIYFEMVEGAQSYSHLF